MDIDISFYTNKGGHSVNEDSFGIGSSVFVVADGLGSHQNSKQASQCAVDYILENTDTDRCHSDEDIVRYLTDANRSVIDMKNSCEFSETVTTAAVAWTGGGEFRCANVGDSRVYYFRHGRIMQQTKDHSVCQASVDMGQMEFDDIRRSADRSKLLKVIGDNNNLKLTKPLPAVKAADGDAFLICSDGFWDYVYEEEMEMDLHKSASASEWLGYMLRRQLARGKNEGDNYTAICGIIHSDTVAELPVKISENSSVRQFGRAFAVVVTLIALAAAVMLILIFVIKGNGSTPTDLQSSQPSQTSGMHSCECSDITQSTDEAVTEDSSDTADTSDTSDTADTVSTADSADSSVTQGGTSEAAVSAETQTREAGEYPDSGTDMPDPYLQTQPENTAVVTTPDTESTTSPITESSEEN